MQFTVYYGITVKPEMSDKLRYESLFKPDK